RSARVNVLRSDGELLIAIGSPPGNGFIGSYETCGLIGTHLLRTNRVALGNLPPEHVRFLDIYEFSDPSLGLALSEYRFGWDATRQCWTDREADRAVLVAPGLDVGVVQDALAGAEHVLPGGCYITRMSPYNPH